MRVYLSLTKLYARSFYNLPGKGAPGAKPDAKAIAKFAGFALLALLVIGQMGALFVMVNMTMYEALAPAGLQGLLLLNAAAMATALTLAIGFLTALSTYFLNDMELQLLAMPIKPRDLFAAKFTSLYLSEAAISLFFMASVMVIFGIKESPHPLMYLWGTLAGLCLPLPALALSYFVQVPLMSGARFLRNKQAILLIGGILGIGLALGFNLYFQSTLSRVGDPAWIAEHMAGPDALLTRMGKAYPPALFAWRSMSEPASAQALLSALGMLSFCAAGPALAVLILSKPYARSLIGFNEAHIKKMGAQGASEFIRTRIKRRPAFMSLILREVRSMNREPMFFLNGPFIIVLMPIIFGIMIAVQKDAFLGDPDMAGLLALISGGGGAIVAGLVGAFLGSGTSITCTALSRDAKALPYLKSLPISAGRYMLAKLAHGLVFALFGSVVGVGLIAYALDLGPIEALYGFAAALGISFIINMGGLWLDTANPRLSWDNPIAAMKQNPNSVIAIFAAMGIAGGAGFAAFKFSLGSGRFALLFGALPLALFGVLAALYPRYAERRLASLEA